MSKKRKVKFILRLYSWLRGPNDFSFRFAFKKSNRRSLCFCHPERRGICSESTGTLLSNKGIFTVSKSTGGIFFILFHPFIELVELNSLFCFFINCEVYSVIKMHSSIT